MRQLSDCHRTPSVRAPVPKSRHLFAVLVLHFCCRVVHPVSSLRRPPEPRPCIDKGATARAPRSRSRSLGFPSQIGSISGPNSLCISAWPLLLFRPQRQPSSARDNPPPNQPTSHRQQISTLFSRRLLTSLNFAIVEAYHRRQLRFHLLHWPHCSSGDGSCLRIPIYPIFTAINQPCLGGSSRRLLRRGT